MMIIKCDPKTGWAVIDQRGIDIRTFSDTRLATIVIWLLVEKGLLAAYLANDDEIESRWAHLSGAAFCVPVDISLAK